MQNRDARPAIEEAPWQNLVGWIGVVLSFMILAGVAVTREGVLQHDELGHLLVARDAWETPRLIFSAWGRTVYTILFMPVASLPLVWARLWNVALAAVTLWLAWRAARRAGVALAWLVPLLTVLQRQYIEIGSSALTEPPFALIMVATFYLAVIGRWRWAACPGAGSWARSRPPSAPPRGGPP